MFLFSFFFNYSLILFNSCSYCKNFNPIAQLVVPIETPSIEAKGELERHKVAAKAKESV